MATIYASYDHRLRILAANVNNSVLFKKFNIPKSTLSTWRSADRDFEVVTLDIFDLEKQQLCSKILELEIQIEQLSAENIIIMELKKIYSFSNRWVRFSSSDAKENILKIVKNASNIIPIKKCLDILDLSATRYWN